MGDYIIYSFVENGITYRADLFGRIFKINGDGTKEPIKGIIFRDDHFIVMDKDTKGYTGGWTLTKTLEDAIYVRDGKAVEANG